MAGTKETLHLSQNGENYRFMGGLFVPNKAHKYHPLELE
jgi:hypothetical protein